MSRVCGWECSTKQNDAFAGIELIKECSSRNEIYLSTFANCKAESDANEFGSRIIYLNSGTVKNVEINGSGCCCKYDLFMLKPTAQPKVEVNKYIGTTSYSTFTKNENKFRMLLRYDTRTQNVLIQRCNIINNKQKRGTQEEFVDKIKGVNDGLIMAWGTFLTIEGTCIANNDADMIINVHSNTGESAVYAARLIIRNCFIDREDKDIYRFDAQFIKEDMPEVTFVNRVNVLNTGICHAELDTITKSPICYTKELINLPSERGLIGMSFIMFILPKGTTPLNN